MIDRNLFVYLTKRAGFTLQDVADRLKLPLTGLYKRLRGEVEFRRDEMESWMEMVGARDAGPIFFPRIVAFSQHSEIAEAGGSSG